MRLEAELSEKKKSPNQAKKSGLGKRIFPILISLIIVGMVMAIVATSFSESSYDVSIADLLEDQDKFIDKEVKVTGNVVYESLRGDPQGNVWEFEIEDNNGKKVTISYRRLLPDPFAYGREVIVEGTLVSAQFVEARNLTVKCPSRYQDGMEGPEDEEMEEHYRDKKPEPSASMSGDRSGM